MNKPFLASIPPPISHTYLLCKLSFLCLLCVATSPPPDNHSPFDQVCLNTTPISPCASEITSVKVPLTLTQRNLMGLFHSSCCLTSTSTQTQSLLPIPLLLKPPFTSHALNPPSLPGPSNTPSLLIKQLSPA